MKRFIAGLLIGLFSQAVCFATPDRTMSISPTAVSGETIAASDENSRNNEVSTKFNEHTHNDITVLTSVNTFTIGDGAVGNKTYAVNTDQSSDPAHRYNTTSDLWTMSNDGSTFLATCHAGDSNGLSSGVMIYGGNSSGAILSGGTMGDGQVFSGTTGGAPRAKTLVGSGAVSISNTEQSITFTANFATPSLTLGTSNSAGSASTLIRSDATVAAFDATVPTTITHGASAATGSAAVASRRDHAHGAPASPAWEFVETLDTATAATPVVSATLPTDSNLFLVVFEDVKGVAGETFTFNPNSDTDADKDYVRITNATLAETTGAAGFVLGAFGTGTATPVNGVIYVPRLATATVNDLLICGSVISLDASDAENQITFLSGHWDGGASNLTTMSFATGGSNFAGGKIHIYKSVPS